MTGTEDGEAFTDKEVSKQAGLPLSPDGALACVHQEREDTLEGGALLEGL